MSACLSRYNHLKYAIFNSSAKAVTLKQCIKKFSYKTKITLRVRICNILFGLWKGDISERNILPLKEIFEPLIPINRDAKNAEH